MDPGARPEASQILRRLGATGDEVAISGRHHVFVGRRPELRALDAAFEGVLGGRAATILIEGEPGVGKSHLVRTFVDRVQRDNPSTVVFSGRCYERESVPYKAVDGVIDGIARYLSAQGIRASDFLPEGISFLAQAFPVLLPFAQLGGPALEIINPRELRHRVFQTLRALLARLAAHAPLVLAIDDLQWADADSAAVLAEVLRAPGEPPLLLVATTRVSTDVTGLSAMAEVAFAGTVRRMRLEKLPAAETQELVEKLLGAPTSDEGARAHAAIAAESGGHPLYIDELVRHGAAPGPGTGPFAWRTRCGRASSASTPPRSASSSSYR